MKKRSIQREAIIKVLVGTLSHPSAEWIYERVKEEIPGIGLATVYRTLRLLKERGEVTELRLRDGSARHEISKSIHYHFYCDRCGWIEDLDEAVDRGIEERVASRTGLIVTGHRLVVTGLCMDCQKLEASQPALEPGLEAMLIAEAESADDVRELFTAADAGDV